MRKLNFSAKWIASGVVILVLVGAALFYLPKMSQGREYPYFLNQTVTAGGVLRMGFADDMDEASVEEGVIIPEEIRGGVSWEDAHTMVIEPEEETEIGEVWRVVVPATVLKADGEMLGRGFEYKFVVAGSPSVSMHTPVAGATDVPTNGQISITFDRPVVPLSSVQGEGRAEVEGWEVTISPEVKGRWRWLGTTTVSFIPEDELAVATKYEVKIPKGLVTLGGDATVDDFDFSFETVRPEVMYTFPGYKDGQVGPDKEVEIGFNVEVNKEAVKEALEVKEMYVEEKVMTVEKVEYKTEKVGGEEIVNKKVVMVKIGGMEFGKEYSVKMAAGAQLSAGELGLEEDVEFSFLTAGDMVVEDVEYSWGLSVWFSNGVDDETLAGNVTISPEIEGWDELELETSDWYDDRSLDVYADFMPGVEYTLTVGDGIKDEYGQNLVGEREFKFTVPDLDPQVVVSNKGDFGIFELEQPKAYYINTVNVEKVKVELVKMDLDNFLSVRNECARNWDCEPSLADKGEYRSFWVDLENVKNEWEVVEFDLEDKMGGTLDSGMYAMAVSAPDWGWTNWRGDFEPVVFYQYFGVTDMAVTMKYSGDRALVWVVDSQTGEAVKNAWVGLHGLDNELNYSGRTDGEGFWEGEVSLDRFANEWEWTPEFWVEVRNGDDTAYMGSSWSDGMDPWNFGMGSDFRGAGVKDYTMESYIYTDRTVYRPGDTVGVKGVMRLRDGEGGLMVPSGRNVQVSVYNAEGDEIMNETVKVNEFGGWSMEVALGEETSLGRWSVNAMLEGDDLRGNYGWGSFRVLEYKKPEYEVTVTSAEDDYFDGDEMRFNVNGNYYFGAVMGEARVEWRLTSTDYFFNRYEGDGWYSFALEDSWCWWDCGRNEEILASGSGQLNEFGELEVTAKADLTDKGVSQVYVLEADVYDPNNQVVSGSVEVPVHKADLYVGVKPESYAVAPGEEAAIDVVTVQPDGNPLPQTDVKVKLMKREWNTVQKKAEDGEYYWESEAEDTLLKETSVKTDENGEAVAKVQIDEGGSYRVVVEAKDSHGRESKAGTSLYAWSSTYVNWAKPNVDRVEIISDKQEYKVGDTAKLLVQSPWNAENVKMLVTAERENVISKEVRNLSVNAEPVEIKITEEMVPNVYVSAVLVKPREGTNYNESGLDTGAPEFKIGYVKLNVETETKYLETEMETNKEQYIPGEEMEIKLSAKDADGKAVRAEYSVAVVDMSVLALTGYSLPDLVNVFYAERGLGVSTATSLAYFLEYYKPGSKGGGGGDGLTDKRENFKDTAYWNPSVVTDENGEATVKFDLPDNLTTWKIIAIGQTKESEFGSVSEEVVETKPVILRAVQPRFAVGGDEVGLSAIVHNYTDEEREFSVRLEGEGVQYLGAQEHKVRIASGGMEKVVFPVRVNVDVEEMKLNFSAETEGARDEVEYTLPVEEFGVRQTVATNGRVDAAVTEGVLAPTSRAASVGSLEVKVSPTLAVYLGDGLDYLVEFPYGCAEQTASSFLGNVAVAQLEGFEAFEVVNDEELEENISTGLQKLYGYQRGDGGFGYWSNSRESLPYLTAYVLYALHEASEAGYTVDEKVMEDAQNYLLTVLKKDEENSLAMRSYVLFVLSEMDRIEVSRINNLYERRDELSIFARAELAMTLMNGDQSARAKEVVDELMNYAKTDPRGVHFEAKNEGSYYGYWQTVTRTTANVLQAMVRVEPENELNYEVVKWLLAVRENGHWRSTQETVSGVLALVEFLEESGELDADFEARVGLNGEMWVNEYFDTENVLSEVGASVSLDDLKRGELNEVQLEKEGEGKLYYDLVMDYFYTGEEEIQPVEEGMGIVREVYRVGDENKTPVTKYELGETYKVVLRITTPTVREAVAVTSPLPAGLEGVDVDMLTVSQELRDEVGNNGYCGWWCWGWSYFTHTEMRDDEIFLFADYLPAGTYEYEYLARATVPGKYKLRPARVWEFYVPENFGQTWGGWVEVAE